MRGEARYRLGVAARIVAALFGGYAVAVAWAVALGRSLPIADSEAAVTATLIATIAMPVAILWCFAARTALRAWVGLGVAIILPLGLAWIAG